jgi:hypothetical protein
MDVKEANEVAGQGFGKCDAENEPQWTIFA